MSIIWQSTLRYHFRFCLLTWQTNYTQNIHILHYMKYLRTRNQLKCIICLFVHWHTDSFHLTFNKTIINKSLRWKVSFRNHICWFRWFQLFVPFLFVFLLICFNVVYLDYALSNEYSTLEILNVFSCITWRLIFHVCDITISST